MHSSKRQQQTFLRGTSQAKNTGGFWGCGLFKPGFLAFCRTRHIFISQVPRLLAGLAPFPPPANGCRFCLLTHKKSPGFPGDFKALKNYFNKTFLDRRTLPLVSISTHFTSTVSPKCKTSSTLLMRCFSISEMCSKPSLPGKISTNAPNG